MTAHVLLPSGTWMERHIHVFVTNRKPVPFSGCNLLTRMLAAPFGALLDGVDHMLARGFFGSAGDSLNNTQGPLTRIASFFC